jgi:hypothetical protein
MHSFDWYKTWTGDATEIVKEETDGAQQMVSLYHTTQVTQKALTTAKFRTICM